MMIISPFAKPKMVLAQEFIFIYDQRKRIDDILYKQQF